MKKNKLQQWLPLLLALIVLSACSKRNYPSKNIADTENRYQEADLIKGDYTPPLVISISDEVAKSNKDGEMYYDNEYGYRYWRFCDGKYYLDSKYESGASPNKKLAKKKTKKETKKLRRQSEEEEYVNQ